MADYEITNERVTPSLTDVDGGVAGDGVNAYEKFVAPWRFGAERSHVISGFVIPASSGNLNIDIPLGVAMISGYLVNVPGSTTVTFTNAANNFVFLKLVRDGNNNVASAKFEVNTSGTKPADSVMIAAGIASGGAITDAWQARQLIPLSLPGLNPPSSVGSGSTRSHEGDIIITANANWSGVHYCRSFFLKDGVTITVPAGDQSLVIIAETAITIEGTIAAQGAGGSGGGGGGGGGPMQPGGAGGSGEAGTDQPGGDGAAGPGGGGGGPGGGGGGSSWSQIHGSIIVVSGTQLTGSKAVRVSQEPSPATGGSGGGGGGGCGGGGPCTGISGGNGGAGGNGGGSIVLIAPIVVLASSATLNTSGSSGNAGQANCAGTGGNGGGGGAGNVYINCRAYTNSGATFTQTGGGGPGTAGQAGVKQINVYG